MAIEGHCIDSPGFKNSHFPYILWQKRKTARDEQSNHNATSMQRKVLVLFLVFALQLFLPANAITRTCIQCVRWPL
jgi:hypothetical protein